MFEIKSSSEVTSQIDALRVSFAVLAFPNRCYVLFARNLIVWWSTQSQKEGKTNRYEDKPNGPGEEMQS
jgi:hypothetical protein